MAQAPLLIKRYASRRLYNTETSDYVTLEDIANFIKSGRDVQIIDLKSGDDLTRQYLLQIIAEHEGRGENVLPINILTDMVRSYTNQASSMLPQFLQNSFEVFRKSQETMIESSPLSKVPGMDSFMQQQEAMLKAFQDTWSAFNPNAGKPEVKSSDEAPESDELRDIKAQLQELSSLVNKLQK